jgi:hypothetical protein
MAWIDLGLPVAKILYTTYEYHSKENGVGDVSPHFLVIARFFAIWEKVCREPTHFLANCEKMCDCKKVLANTWDDFSQLRESVWAPPTLSRKLRESVESPIFFLKDISSVSENGLFAFLTVNLRE